MEGGYKVKWGDTAWRVAEQLRTNDSQTIEQIVLALYRANPQAFFGNNINNLKSGQILKIPEGTQVESVTPVQARTEFRAQYDAWQEYKIKLAGASAGIKVVENEPKQAPVAAAKEPEAKPEPKKEPEAKKEPANVTKVPPPAKGAQQEDLLKIVRSTLQGEKTTPDKKPAEGEAPKDRGAKEQQALADRVATLEESLASKQVETKEIGDKVAQVRAQLKREARLIQIEQQDLAAAQVRAKAAQPAPPVEPPKPQPVVKAEPAPAPKIEPPKPVEPPVAATPPTPAPEKPAVAPTPKPPVVVAPIAKPTTDPAPAAEKSFFDEIIENVLAGDSFLPILIGVIVLASVGIGFVYMKRRRKSIAEFEESILQSEGIPGTTGEPSMTTDTSGQVVSSGDTSFLSDFSQGGMGNIHTDEVDPIAEAEVYLAYGRDETAEEILKEAVIKNPAREELRVKLLEIYANRSDVRAFETLAEEMYASMGGRPSKNWPRVEELGRKLNPNNPMFKGGGAPIAAKAPATPNFSDTAKMKAVPVAAAPSTATVIDVPTSIAASPAGSDFDFDMETAASPTPAASQGLDFDMGSPSPKASAAEASLDFSSDDLGSSSSGGMEVDLGQSSNVVDFDFGDKEETATPVAAAAEVEMSMEAPSNGAGASGGDALTETPQWDETATKLDLARAYIDMGDAEGARSILDEVMSEGNDQQKSQAKELAAQL